MYSSSLRTTYGLTLRGPDRRLNRGSPSTSSMTGGTGIAGLVTIALWVARTGRGAGRAGAAAGAARTAALRGAGFALTAARGAGRGALLTGAETVFLGLVALADGFLAGIGRLRGSLRGAGLYRPAAPGPAAISCAVKRRKSARRQPQIKDRAGSLHRRRVR